ncbi:MAG: hypothetical protein ACRDKT_06910 [Actinomycetota bacterium]
MKKLISVLLAGSLVFGVVANASAKPKQVFEDAAGDADLGHGLGASIPAGWDIASGAIERKGKNLEFTVTHHDMPPFGSMPEFTRFLWNFNVGSTPYRITAKSVDIGKPDPATQTGTERIGRVDVSGHFRLEGECVTEGPLPVQFVNCPVVGYYTGTWDPATMSFTMVIPMKDIKAKKGSVVSGGGDNICIICWVSHYAERSLSPQTIIDSAAQTVSYKIP